MGVLQKQLSAYRTGSKVSRETKRNLVAYSFIAPNFIGFAVFTLIPIVFAFVLAFMEWDGSNPIKWVGLENFSKLAKDQYFIAALKNTIIYCVGTVPLTMICSLALAVILNQKVVGRGVFRTLAFFPYVASLVAITSVWKMLFHPSKGPINNILLNVFQVPQESLPQWFSGGLVLLSMILFSVWKYMGYYMVIYLAGLQGISSELYEAASLDGATTWQKFRYITWPQLNSTTFFVVVMLTINCFKVYDIAIMLAGGGSGELTLNSTVLVYYIYQKAFIDWKLGYSSAVAMVLFLLVLVVTLIQFRGEKKLTE
ncbi:MAG: carbohydrate ABC transporter permease [Agathobacter sp.]